MKLSRTELFDLMTGLQSAVSVVGNSKYTYATAKTRRVIKPLIVEIQAKHEELLSDYKKEMNALAIEFSEKDKATGQPKLNQGRTFINPVFKDDWEKKKAEITERYQSVLDEKDSYMDEKIDVDIHVIKHGDFPDMQDNLADLLFPMREVV